MEYGVCGITDTYGDWRPKVKIPDRFGYAQGRLCRTKRDKNGAPNLVSYSVQRRKRRAPFVPPKPKTEG